MAANIRQIPMNCREIVIYKPLEASRLLTTPTVPIDSKSLSERIFSFCCFCISYLPLISLPDEKKPTFTAIDKEPSNPLEAFEIPIYNASLQGPLMADFKSQTKDLYRVYNSNYNRRVRATWDATMGGIERALGKATLISVLASLVHNVVIMILPSLFVPSARNPAVIFIPPVIFYRLNPISIHNAILWKSLRPWFFTTIFLLVAYSTTRLLSSLTPHHKRLERAITEIESSPPPLTEAVANLNLLACSTNLVKARLFLSHVANTAQELLDQSNRQANSLMQKGIGETAKARRHFSNGLGQEFNLFSDLTVEDIKLMRQENCSFAELYAHVTGSTLMYPGLHRLDLNAALAQKEQVRGVLLDSLTAQFEEACGLIEEVEKNYKAQANFLNVTEFPQDLKNFNPIKTVKELQRLNCELVLKAFDHTKKRLSKPEWEEFKAQYKNSAESLIEKLTKECERIKIVLDEMDLHLTAQDRQAFRDYAQKVLRITLYRKRPSVLNGDLEENLKAFSKWHKETVLKTHSDKSQGRNPLFEEATLAKEVVNIVVRASKGNISLGEYNKLHQLYSNSKIAFPPPNPALLYLDKKFPTGVDLDRIGDPGARLTHLQDIDEDSAPNSGKTPSLFKKRPPAYPLPETLNLPNLLRTDQRTHLEYEPLRYPERVEPGQLGFESL